MAARASGDSWWKRPLAIDVAVVVVLAAVLTILVTVASESGAREVDALAYVVALAALTLTVFLTACVPSTDTSSPRPPVSENPTVTIQGMSFTPDRVTIEEGDTVTWVWGDGDMPHDVSGVGFKVQTEGTFTHTFEDAGDYPYVCTLHSG